MKFRVSSKPVFQFELTTEELSFLLSYSLHHSDKSCRAASNPYIPDNFLYKWKQVYRDGNISTLSASQDELELCCQILDGCHQYPALKLRDNFCTALKSADTISQRWSETIILNRVEPTRKNI